MADQDMFTVINQPRKPRRMYPVTCMWDCGKTWEIPRKPPADGLGCGQPACLRKREAAYQAELAEFKARRREAAKVRRETPVSRPVLGEWGVVLGIGRTKKGRR